MSFLTKSTFPENIQAKREAINIDDLQLKYEKSGRKVGIFKKINHKKLPWRPSREGLLVLFKVLPLVKVGVGVHQLIHRGRS